MANLNWHEIVHRQVESDVLDYKAPLNWITMPRQAKAKFIRHCLAFANTKGGCIVVGVEEDSAGHPSVYTGLNREQVKSFDPSTVGPFINRHVDPSIDFTIERPLVDGKRFAIFVIKPFSNIPHVCNASIDGELQQGVFYIRTTDASSRPAYRSSELHGIIQRALRNQRELLGRMLRGLLYENHLLGSEDDSKSRFDEERRHAREFFIQRRHVKSNTPTVRLEFTAVPQNYVAEKFSATELKSAASKAINRYYSELFLTPQELRHTYTANTLIRAFIPEKEKLWQFNKSGLCYFTCFIATPEKKLDFAMLKGITFAAVNFIADAYAELNYSDELIQFDTRLYHCNNCSLINPSGEPLPADCSYSGSGITIQISRSAADWLSGREAHTHTVLRELAERFKVPDGRLAKIKLP